METLKLFVLTFLAVAAGYAIGGVVLLIRYMLRGGAVW